jgi:UDP-N-acetylmuramoyl-tripeptide--D-alanyl-D-alanine ligase
MTSKLGDALKQIATPLGRHLLHRQMLRSAWPILSRIASAYRRTLATQTRIVVVVGSFGKTTTTKTIAAALGTSVARGNEWSRIAQAILQIKPWRQQHAVIEIGIDGRDQMSQYAALVRPDTVVITSIGSEHNRSLGSLENTRNEKAKILSGLRPNGVVVLNGDDPNVLPMAAITDAKIIRFGFAADNHVRAIDMYLEWPHGTHLTVQICDSVFELSVRLVGKVMMYPILAALAVAWSEGLRIEQVVQELERVPPVTGRLQLVELEAGAWLIRDDCKSPLETIHAALDVASEVPGRLIVVIGEISEPVGNQRNLYGAVGERLASIATRVIVVGKSFRRIARGATNAGMSSSSLINSSNSIRHAIDAVTADLRSGDVVLVKGRDTQRLDRVALALQGRTIGCEIEVCNMRSPRCDVCPMLESGWKVAPDTSILD